MRFTMLTVKLGKALFTGENFCLVSSRLKRLVVSERAKLTLSKKVFSCVCAGYLLVCEVLATTE
jgi:hypothetical protein